jgi:hypothetical protein
MLVDVFLKLKLRNVLCMMCIWSYTIALHCEYHSSHLQLQFKIQTIYDATNFSTNLQFKLNLEWFKDVDIKI